MTLDECRAATGERVIFDAESAWPKHGVIDHVNGRYVFVRYSGDRITKATVPTDLRLA